MAHSSDPMDDFWKHILSEPDDDIRKEKNREWFRKQKKKSASDGDSYSDGDSCSDKQGNSFDYFADSLENKMERAFDSLFYESSQEQEKPKRFNYESPPKDEKPKRFNWVRNRSSPEEEQDQRPMKIFAAPGPAMPFTRTTSSTRTWFPGNSASRPSQSFDDERDDTQQQRGNKKEIPRHIYKPTVTIFRDERNNTQQQRGSKKESPRQLCKPSVTIF
jgi:hypothetical protein